MKDLIEKILVYLPQYLADFGSLMSGPKTFIAQINAASEEAFVKAVLFLEISLIIVVIMTAPFLLPERDLWAHVGTTAVGFLLGVSLYAVALRLAWLIVGGKAAIKSFFVIYAYYFSVGMVVLMLFYLLGEGIFKIFSPDLYAKMIEAKLIGNLKPDLSGNPVVTIALFVRTAGFASVFAWGIWGWGAYRVLNGLSRARSAIALSISIALAIPVIVIANLVMAAMVQL